VTLSEEGVPSSRSHKLALLLLIPLVVVLVGLLATLYVTNTTIEVDGPSMVPTLMSADLVIVTRTYDSPVRGDIVVLEPPDLPMIDPDRTLIKRIVAKSGDTVEFRSGALYVNGVPESGEYAFVPASTGYNVGPVSMPEGYVFVVGDNRPESLDSRTFGPVPASSVLGKVVARFAPIDRIGFVD
jgi:signal peptidase I